MASRITLGMAGWIRQKAEAMQGDPQAVRKLARLQTQSQTPQPKVEAAPTSMNAPDSTGRLFKATV